VEKETDQIYGTKTRNTFKLITKKPLTPGAGEIKNNPRSRSAKLRIAEKI
jgi:16S rRNA (cytosine1402-N4)-methyltransferase